MSPRRAFTLIELIAAMVVLGVAAGVAGPVIVAASGAYSDASSRRDAAERVSAAMERIVRVLREAPPTLSGATTPAITTAGAGEVEFGDGSRLELDGVTLWITLPAQAAAPLCVDVEAFTLGYLGNDGVTDTSASPTDTQRITVLLRSGGVEMRSCAFVRVAMGGAS